MILKLSKLGVTFLVIFNVCGRTVSRSRPLNLNSFNIHSEILQSNSLPSHKISNSRQTNILFPFPDPAPEAEIPTRTSFLPNLGFLSDLSLLLLPEFPASGMVRLGRDILESEQCVEKVSCMATDVSGRHSYLNWLHNLLIDFPFEGDLADRMKIGASIKQTSGSGCEFSCNPTITLRRAFNVMKLLNDIVNVNIVANKIK